LIFGISTVELTRKVSTFIPHEIRADNIDPLRPR